MRVLASTIAASGRSGNHDYRLDSIEQHGDRVVVSFSWADRAGHRHAWAQALQIRNGRIIDMQDYRSAKHAAASARVRAVFA